MHQTILYVVCIENNVSLFWYRSKSLIPGDIDASMKRWWRNWTSLRTSSYLKWPLTQRKLYLEPSGSFSHKPSTWQLLILGRLVVWNFIPVTLWQLFYKISSIIWCLSSKRSCKYVICMIFYYYEHISWYTVYKSSSLLTKMCLKKHPQTKNCKAFSL